MSILTDRLSRAYAHCQTLMRACSHGNAHRQAHGQVHTAMLMSRLSQADLRAELRAGAQADRLMGRLAAILTGRLSRRQAHGWALTGKLTDDSQAAHNNNSLPHRYGRSSPRFRPAPNGPETKRHDLHAPGKVLVGLLASREKPVYGRGTALLVSRGPYVASARFCAAIGRVLASNREEAYAFMI